MFIKKKDTEAISDREIINDFVEGCDILTIFDYIHKIIAMQIVRSTDTELSAELALVQERMSEFFIAVLRREERRNANRN